MGRGEGKSGEEEGVREDNKNGEREMERWGDGANMFFFFFGGGAMGE